VTGLHALDGARYLRDAQHADAMLCRLVAHHSCAIIEARERGLADVLSLEFDPALYALASVLTCCDMTISPDGELVPVEQRNGPQRFFGAFEFLAHQQDPPRPRRQHPASRRSGSSCQPRCARADPLRSRW
jgi:hypothetical protein